MCRQRALASHFVFFEVSALHCVCHNVKSCARNPRARVRRSGEGRMMVSRGENVHTVAENHFLKKGNTECNLSSKKNFVELRCPPGLLMATRQGHCTRTRPHRNHKSYQKWHFTFPNVMWNEQTTICKLTQAVPPSATQETSKLLRQFAAIRSKMGSSTTQKTDVRGLFTKPLRNSLLRGKSWLNEKHWHFDELLDTSSNLERSVCAHKISETHP